MLFWANSKKALDNHIVFSQNPSEHDSRGKKVCLYTVEHIMCSIYLVLVVFVFAVTVQLKADTTEQPRHTRPRLFRSDFILRHTFTPPVKLSFCCIVCQNENLPLGGPHRGDWSYFKALSYKGVRKKLSLPCGFLLIPVNIPDQSHRQRVIDSEVTKDTTLCQLSANM